MNVVKTDASGAAQTAEKAAESRRQYETSQKERAQQERDYRTAQQKTAQTKGEINITA
jgi:hypothetical protein